MIYTVLSVQIVLDYCLTRQEVMRIDQFVCLCVAPCGLRGCKNGPAPFPGRMSYKATKPGLDFVLYLSMFFCVDVY